MNGNNLKILAASFVFSLFWAAVFNSLSDRVIPGRLTGPSVIEAETPGKLAPRFEAEMEPCRDEMDRLCADASNSRQAYSCLMENEETLSAGCRAVTEKFKAPIIAACGAEIGKFCAGMNFGGSRIRNCLLARESELSKTCRAHFETGAK